MNKKIPVLLTILLAGCSSIEHSKKIEQATNTPLFAGAGDVVIHINHERDLENAYGNADIFGRKTKEGFSELRFLGASANGDIILAREGANKFLFVEQMKFKFNKINKLKRVIS